MGRGFLRHNSGNIAILSGLIFSFIAASAALAVDVGSLYLEKRRLQAAVDLAAIEAARSPGDAFNIAHQVIARAGFASNNITVQVLKDPESPIRLNVSKGRYRADPNVAPDLRFTPEISKINAVEVRFETPGRLFFAGSWSPVPTISASAIAATEAQVAFSLGSRLAALGDGFPNALLNQLLGTTINLKAIDYNGLAQVNVSTFQFLDALAFELGITAGTYDDVLNASASHHQILKAIAKTASGADSALARTIATAVSGSNGVNLSKIIDLGTFKNLDMNAGAEPFSLMLNALDLVGASAVLANGSRQAEISLPVNIQGVTRITAKVAIGEPAQKSGWVTVGAPGASVHTAQIRVLLVAEIPGVLGLVPITVKLPVYLDIAASEAIVVTATCPVAGSSRGTATIAAMPGLASLTIGKIDEAAMSNFERNPIKGKETIVDVLGLVGVSAFGQVAVAQPTPKTLTFSSNDIAKGVVKTASTRTIVGSLMNSLLDRTALSVDMLKIPLLQVGGVLKLVGGLLKPAAPLLDSILIGLLDALGISVGEADVKVYGVTCTTPVLVG